MCHFIVSNHTYSECKLLDTAEPEPVPTVPDGQSSAPANSPQISQMTRLMRHLGSFHKSTVDDAQKPAVADETGSSAVNVLQSGNSSETNIHVVTQKTFIQCLDARDPDHEDAQIWDIPVNRRTCADATEFDFGADAVDDEDYGHRSELRGRCPVCEAVESAIAKSSFKVTVKPAKARTFPGPNSRTPNITQASTVGQNISQSQAHRKRSKRHKHHGTGKGLNEGERAVRASSNGGRRDRESNYKEVTRTKVSNGEQDNHRRMRPSFFRLLFGNGR